MAQRTLLGLLVLAATGIQGCQRPDDRLCLRHHFLFNIQSVFSSAMITALVPVYISLEQRSGSESAWAATVLIARRSTFALGLIGAAAWVLFPAIVGTVVGFSADTRAQSIASLDFMLPVKRRTGRVGRVLNIGIGGGGVERRMLAAKWSVMSLDPDKAAVIQMKALGVDARQGYAQQIPVENVFVDVVIVSEVLEHIPDADRKTPISEIARILKPGGLLIGTVPYRETLRPFARRWQRVPSLGTRRKFRCRRASRRGICALHRPPMPLARLSIGARENHYGVF